MVDTRYLRARRTARRPNPNPNHHPDPEPTKSKPNPDPRPIRASPTLTLSLAINRLTIKHLNPPPVANYFSHGSTAHKGADHTYPATSDKIFDVVHINITPQGYSWWLCCALWLSQEERGAIIRVHSSRDDACSQGPRRMTSRFSLDVVLVSACSLFYCLLWIS